MPSESIRGVTGGLALVSVTGPRKLAEGALVVEKAVDF